MEPVKTREYAVRATQAGSVSIHAPSRRGEVADVVPVPWVELGGVRVGVVLWGGLALVDVGRLAHAPSYAALGAVAVLVTVSSVGMRTSTALAAALVGWLVIDGFVVHSVGVLGFDGPPDVARLGLLVGLATTASRARR
jgi:hypothetical protein